MQVRKFNWPLWTGFLLSLFAFLSYFFLFVWFPSTRDFPWANLLLFAGALVLLLLGLRRGFSTERARPTRSKIVSSIVTALGGLVFAFFIFVVFVSGRWLPPSHGAPKVGQKAPDFSLADKTDKTVSLSELLSTPINGKAPRGVLLVFYRGWW
jgi:hypothetical protein